MSYNGKGNLNSVQMGSMGSSSTYAREGLVAEIVRLLYRNETIKSLKYCS